MSSSGLGSALFGRRVVAVSALGMLLAIGSVGHAQTPAAPAAPDQRFIGSGERGMIIIFVKPDKTADFEAVMAKLKEAIATPDKPDDPAATPEAAKAAAELKARKAKWRKQAEGWSVLKVAEPMGANATYVWSLNPAVDGGDYNPTPILYDNFPYDDAQALFGKLGGTLAGIQKWTVTKLLDMK